MRLQAQRRARGDLEWEVLPCATITMPRNSWHWGSCCMLQRAVVSGKEVAQELSCYMCLFTCTKEVPLSFRGLLHKSTYKRHVEHVRAWWPLCRQSSLSDLSVHLTQHHPEEKAEHPVL